MSLNANLENKILAKISESTVLIELKLYYMRGHVVLYVESFTG